MIDIFNGSTDLYVTQKKMPEIAQTRLIYKPNHKAAFVALPSIIQREIERMAGYVF